MEHRIAKLTLSYDTFRELLGENVPGDARIVLVHQRAYDIVRRECEVYIESSEFPATPVAGEPWPLSWNGE